MRLASLGGHGQNGVNRWMLAFWLAASVIWGTAVIADVYHRARVEASMSNDVERELDQSACQETDCSDDFGTSAWKEGWRDVAKTYLQYGYVDILEWATVPPLGLLIAGLGANFVLRRRRQKH